MSNNVTNDECTFYFLDKVFTDTNDKAIMAQVLINEQFSRTVISKIMSLEMLSDLYKRSLTKDNVKIDFSVEDGFLKCDTIPRIQLKDADMYKDVIGEESTSKPLVKTIYDLFDDVIECNGLLVNNKILTATAKDIVDLGVVRFLPIYSQSTMTCYISMHLDDEWKSIKLIYTENGEIKTGKFVFAIPTTQAHRFEKYNLSEVCKCLYNKDSYTVFYYDDALLTLAYNMDDIRVLPSICNRYVFMSELYKQILKACSLITLRLTEGLYGVAPKPDFNIDRKDYASKYTDVYVTFSLRYKALKSNEIEGLILDCFQNVIPKIVAKEMDINSLMSYVRGKYKTIITRMVYLDICKILINGGSEPLDRLDYANKLMSYYKIRKFKVDTLLYMMRVGFFVVPVKLEYGNTALLRGSDAPYTTLLEKRK